MMTDKIQILQIDAETGIETLRDLTDEELQEREESELKAKAELDAKEASRTSALAKLAALGLTEEEIAAL
jgi:hypothetical protein